MLFGPYAPTWVQLVAASAGYLVFMFLFYSVIDMKAPLNGLPKLTRFDGHTLWFLGVLAGVFLSVPFV